MLKVFEEMKSYNENYMLGAERVYKYRKIKFVKSYNENDILGVERAYKYRKNEDEEEEFFEDPHRNGRFEEITYLLYGIFLDNINEDEPYPKSRYKNMEYKSGIEIMGMKPNKTKDGKYMCNGISLAELKNHCIMNGIKGYSKCDKLGLVKLLMKVDSQDTPIKKINKKNKVEEVKPVVEEVEVVQPIEEVVEVVQPIEEVVKEVKPVIIDFKPIVEPKQKDESYANYFYTLFGDKFIYCGIHLSTEGLKPCGKPKKKPFFPFGYDKIDKPLIKPFKSKDKKTQEIISHIPNGVILLQEQSNYSSIDVDIPEECTILDQLFKDCNQVHKTKNGFHFIFKSNDLPRELCGIVDINTNLFYVPEYFNEHNDLYGKYEILKNDGLVEMPEYAYKYCEEMIMNKTKNKTLNKTKKSSNKSIVNYDDRKIYEFFNLEVMDAIYKIRFENGDLNNFDNWLKVCWVGRHLNNTEGSFKLFLKYSRMVKGFENEPEDVVKSHFYQKNQYDKYFNELSHLYNIRKVSKEKYIKEIDPLLNGNKFMRDCVKFNSRYIYTEENKHIFDDFVKKGGVIAISSPYGTGKTYTFKKLIPNFEKILFITYRQSLAQSLYSELDCEGFKNYKELENDKLQHTDRLIIQLDSLGRIHTQDSFTLQNTIPHYDLVVVDEMEGILSHFNAKTLERKQETYDVLTRLLTESKNVFCLDGDLHNRSLDYLQNTIKRNLTFYQNEHKPEKKKIKFTRNLKYFNAEMSKDLKNNKKLVVPCMICNATQEYKTKYTEEGYNVVCHNGIEKNTKTLKNYKEEWNKADLLIYSPTIEAGVDFDMKHFDNCYGYMSEGSTCARAFSQMLHRVRQFDSDEILIYIGNMFYSENCILYTPEMLENRLFEGYNTSEGLGNIQKYNKCEELNTQHYLLNDFVSIIGRKGYDWEILKEEKKEKADKYDYITRKQGITDAKILVDENDNLDRQQYDRLIQIQKDGELTEDETYILDKYFMSLNFNIDIHQINGEFVEELFRKEYIIDNYNTYLKVDYSNGEKLEKSYDNDLLGDKVEKINKIFSWFKDEEGNKVDYLSNDVLRENFTEYFKDPSVKQLFKNYPKMGGDKKLYENVNNHILNELGFEFVSKRKQYRDKTTGKMKETNIYTIGHCKILKDYLNRDEEQKLKLEQAFQDNLDEWDGEDDKSK